MAYFDFPAGDPQLPRCLFCQGRGADKDGHDRESHRQISAEFAFIRVIRRSSAPKSPCRSPRKAGPHICLHPCHPTFIRCQIALASSPLPFHPRQRGPPFAVIRVIRRSSVPKRRCFCLFARRATPFTPLSVPSDVHPCPNSPCPSPLPFARRATPFALIRVIRFSSVPKRRCFCLFARRTTPFAFIREIRRSSVPKTLALRRMPFCPPGNPFCLYPCNQTFIRAQKPLLFPPRQRGPHSPLSVKSDVHPCQKALALRRMPFCPQGQPLLTRYPCNQIFIRAKKPLLLPFCPQGNPIRPLSVKSDVHPCQKALALRRMPFCPQGNPFCRYPCNQIFIRAKKPLLLPFRPPGDPLRLYPCNQTFIRAKMPLPLLLPFRPQGKPLCRYPCNQTFIRAKNPCPYAVAFSPAGATPFAFIRVIRFSSVPKSRCFSPPRQRGPHSPLSVPSDVHPCPKTLALTPLPFRPQGDPVRRYP